MILLAAMRELLADVTISFQPSKSGSSVPKFSGRVISFCVHCMGGSSVANGHQQEEKELNLQR
jgi:hypothetical protein